MSITWPVGVKTNWARTLFLTIFVYIPAGIIAWIPITVIKNAEARAAELWSRGQGCRAVKQRPGLQGCGAEARAVEQRTGLQHFGAGKRDAGLWSREKGC